MRLKYVPWKTCLEHINIISITFKILVKLNQMIPKYYKYLAPMVEDQYAIYLLNESMSTLRHEYPFNIIMEKMVTGDDNFDVMEINSEELWYSHNFIYVVMFIYFLRQFMSRDILIYDNNQIEDAKESVESISSEGGAICMLII